MDADQFGFGEPEFVFTTRKSQKFRTRKPFRVDEHRRGSVVRHSAFQSEFSKHHFVVPTESRFPEAIPSQSLHPLFVAVAVPVTFHLRSLIVKLDWHIKCLRVRLMSG